MRQMLNHKLYLANKYIDQLSVLADTFPGAWKKGLTPEQIDTVNSIEALEIS